MLFSESLSRSEFHLKQKHLSCSTESSEETGNLKQSQQESPLQPYTRGLTKNSHALLSLNRPSWTEVGGGCQSLRFPSLAHLEGNSTSAHIWSLTLCTSSNLGNREGNFCDVSTWHQKLARDPPINSTGVAEQPSEVNCYWSPVTWAQRQPSSGLGVGIHQ